MTSIPEIPQILKNSQLSGNRGERAEQSKSLEIAEEPEEVMFGVRFINKTQGYVKIKPVNHPNVEQQMNEHRLVMEKHLGSFLDKNEQVHHINEDKKDNRIENLQVMSSSKHQKLHKKGTTHPLSKLSKKQVKEIRAKQHAGYSYNQITEEMPIKKSAVAKICQGKRYADLV